MHDFSAITDWTAYLRDLIARPLVHRELVVPGTDPMGTRSTILAFAGSLAGSPYLENLLDAGLALVEAGTPEEIEVAGTLPFGEPHVDRILDILGLRGAELDRDSFAALATTAVAFRPGDPRVVAALEDRANRFPPEATDLLRLALGSLSTWVVARVARYADARHDPSGAALAILIALAKPGTRCDLLDAIAHAGPEFVERAVTCLRTYPEIARTKLRADLAAHPAFRQAAI